MENTTTRRALLKAVPLAAAAAAIPASTIAVNVTKSEWEGALAAYRAARRHYDELCERTEWAEENDGGPDRIDHYFDDYKLGIGMKREAVEFWLRHYVARTGDKIDIAATADAFDDYQRAVLDARERSGREERYAEQLAYLPTYRAARDRLMATPAPDAAAMLFKIESVGDIEDMELIQADARRLLGGEA